MEVAPDRAAPETERPPARVTGAFSVADLIDLLRRRWRLIAATAGVMVLLAGLYLVNQTAVYRATAELLIDPQALQVVGRDIVRTDTAASIDFANVDSQALVIVSTSVLQQVINELKLQRDPAFAPQPGWIARHFGALMQTSPEQQMALTLEALKKSIVVHRVDNSLVFQITVSHPDAKQAATIANTLASAYFRQGSEGRSGAVRRANASLIAQIVGLRDQLTHAENAVEAFRSANGLVSAGDSGLIVNQQVRDLYTQINLASAEVARQAARRDQAAKVGANALLTDTIPEALGSPTISALRAQYAQTAKEAASLAETLMPRHPQLMQAQAQLAEIRRQLAAELARIRSSIQEAYSQAAGNLANLQAQAKELTKSQSASSAAEIKLRELQGEADAIRTVYNASLSRARELEQQQKIETSNSRLISEAAPPLRASKPPTVLVLAAAALFGACAGLGLAYLIEWLPKLGFAIPVRRKLRKVEPIVESPVTVAARSIPSSAIRSDWGLALDDTSAPSATFPTTEPPPPLRDEPQPEAAEPAPHFDLNAIGPLAETLQRDFGGAAPAVILIVSLIGERRCRQTASALADALNQAGGDVSICAPNTSGETLRIEETRRAALPAAADEHADSPVRVVKATSGASIAAAFAAMRGDRAGAAKVFLLAQATRRDRIKDMAGAADAILVCSKGRQPRELAEIEKLLGPSSVRLLAIVDTQPRESRLSRIMRRDAA